MGLAIDGNVVNGIARGGQAFVGLGNTNADGSINIGGQDYFSKNKMAIKDAGRFNVSFNRAYDGTALVVPIDVTSNLSNYGGCLAICVMGTDNAYRALIKSQPMTIPTAPTTYKFAFEDSSQQNEGWSGTLSRTADNKFTFVVDCTSATYITTAVGNFYILSNKAS